MALNINTGGNLPSINIDNAGELQLAGDDISYSAWSTQQLNGKVRLIQAMAGRTSAKELNAPMIEAVKQAKFGDDVYQTVTIVNLDDAIFGTSGFVKGKLKKNKKAFALFLATYGKNFQLVNIFFSNYIHCTIQKVFSIIWMH